MACNRLPKLSVADNHTHVSMLEEGQKLGMCLDSKSKFEEYTMEKCGLTLGLRKGHA